MGAGRGRGHANRRGMRVRGGASFNMHLVMRGAPRQVWGPGRVSKAKTKGSAEEEMSREEEGFEGEGKEGGVRN